MSGGVCCGPVLHPDFPKSYRWGFTSGTRKLGVLQWNWCNRNASCPLRLLHGHVWFWASPSLWLSVNIGFSAPILQLDKLIFCGNVPKRSSVTLLMPQYMTLNRPLSSYPSLKLAAQQFSIMETWAKAPTPIKCFEVCMLQHLLSNNYKAQGF